MIDLRLGDCLEVMPNIPDKSIDMIMADLPYGTTQNKWDTIIPFEPLWEQYKRIIKDNGAIVLTGQGLFSAKLIISNEKYYRYTTIWEKSRPGGFLNANRMPLQSHEDIVVFYTHLPTFNPQFTSGNPYIKKIVSNGDGKNYGKFERVGNVMDNKGVRFPISVVKIPNDNHKSIHPTKKPVALMSYLIKTYTNEGDTVLDNVMGSGTTGVACKLLKRNFIGIELDPTYFEIAKSRINTTQEMML